MSRINLMSAELANRIAAGEVVDRPASVVKELVENSIDAQSKKIVVEIKGAGRKEIKVKDDGCGMDSIDAELCFLRHASSKIKSTFDLKRITTLGFRGEALPSISAVSNINMLTYDGTSSKAIECYVEPGKDPIVKEGIPRKGTSFTITDLFFNTPARLKYLKSDNTENAAIIETCEKLALSHPSISFELLIDGKRILKTSGRGVLLETISEIYGLDIAKSCIPVKGENDFYKVSGFIAKPNISYASRFHIVTFLNQRSVYSYKVSQSIINSYKDYLPPNRYPFAILNIDVDYSLVDVNVHPLKREVRLSEEESLTRLVEELCKNALLGDRPVFTPVKIKTAELEKVKPVIEQLTLSDVEKEYVEPIKQTSEEKIVKDDLEKEKTEEIKQISSYDDIKTESYSIFSEETIYKKEEVKTEINKDEVFANLLNSEPKTTLPDLVVVGQILKTYIVCDSDDGMYLIDQHAAQERINFEKVLTEFSKKEIEVCFPLSPIFIEVSNSVMLRFESQKFDKLKEFGFEIERFSHNTLRVNTLPVFLKDEEDTSIIKDLICSIIEENNFNYVDLKRLAFATAACKASIKANMFLTKPLMETLIKQLSECKNPNNCPHGRPTIIKLSKSEIEKLFKRTGF